jgi:hypothetical protein
MSIRRLPAPATPQPARNRACGAIRVSTRLRSRTDAADAVAAPACRRVAHRAHARGSVG